MLTGGVEQVRPSELGGGGAGSKENRSPSGPGAGGGATKPYPEVTLHPVSPPSLLHQVLTKATPVRQHANYSPTLARLLTAPDRPAGPPPHFRPPARVSIADILSSTKVIHF